ncbi:MAG: hypothetical protein A2306_07745 [Omnitrophica WOR_2 bacterium RIFOXYB2_FULL_38_16]|nr:MAG: hypothetical protein A2243_01540 [Omnitrophica WOR_2 bacterium RIFOXYA2_FULL_38_17]OGX54264.1 MAG: hypothetical protein A2267_01990 [Omnitrophica WOR_2 bacterium RIFOXYA12_FULL_38_10]OGX55041.1 MAG: hypothetical protein A2447_10950 [Omnitrophica WOR_2 bacterium RIFOXYC2_FULL_38_12]OGX60497.1 MAG: hypothetical protein A2306_07745 [Omnitrophica WOR_2 bacterium RIFOXYB2_FULL_38_16]HBG62278.1 hypothetical protein [Candidatus Omnitrophota bacterium]
MKRSFLILTLLFILIHIVNAEEVRGIDTNGDNQVDQWLFTKGSDLVKLEEDFDFDGIVDKRALFFYKNGQKVKVEIDSNMDGKADGWSYHRNDQRYLIESDTNYDGAADYVIDNDKQITLIDSNYDGQMDIKELKDKRSIDSNSDGKFDTEELKTLDLETWLGQERIEYLKNLQIYMRNTHYKQKAGLE